LWPEALQARVVLEPVVMAADSVVGVAAHMNRRNYTPRAAIADDDPDAGKNPCSERPRRNFTP